MADEKISGKWAAEAFDFIKLFQRVGDTFTGLLLVEIGWAVLLTLIVALSEPDTVPILEIPLIARGFEFQFVKVSLSGLFSVGAIAILVIWTFTSRLHLYIFIPLARILRWFLKIVVPLILFSLLIITLPITLILFFIEVILFRRWKRKLDQDKLQKYLDEKGEAGEDALLKRAREEMRFSASWIADILQKPYSRIMQNLASFGAVGLAPIYSSSFLEEQKAVKVPIQLFSAAIGQLRQNLSTFQSLSYIRFTVLPAMTKIYTDGRARSLRNWFGFDALLWGSYLSVDPPRIWLNIENQLGEKEESKLGGRQRDLVWEQKEEPFPYSIKLDTSMVVINQGDPLDAYIVLLFTLILGLRSRRPSLRARRNRLPFQSFDILRYSYDDEEDLFTSLIRDTLFRIEDPITESDIYPSAKELLVEFSGKWVGSKLTDADELRRGQSVSLLIDIARKCAKLMPDDPAHYYRLGVLYCLADDSKKALAFFKRGMEKDKSAGWQNPYYLMARAGLDLKEYSSTIGLDSKLKLAMYAYRVSHALAADENLRASMADDFMEEALVFQPRKAAINTEPWAPIEIVVYDLLGIDRRNIEKEWQEKEREGKASKRGKGG